MADSGNHNLAIYEQPLNERVRTLLRLEFLYEQARQGLCGESEWHSRRAIDGLLDILAVLARGDLRSEVIKELERLLSSLQRLEDSPDVAQERLHHLLEDCRGLIGRLREVQGHIGIDLKSNELLASIMQRSGVAGGTCGFDLPAYQHWLLQPAESRQQQLVHWYSRFDDLREAGALILKVLRESSVLRPQNAPGGLFQRNLDRTVAYQMIRVAVPDDAPYFPEVSASKLFFTVRFMSQPDTGERPAHREEDIQFRLGCCVI